MATKPQPLPFPPPSLRVAATVSIIITFVVFLSVATYGVIWAFTPTPSRPENPPVVHIFTPDLTIQSPHTYTSPTSVADWLDQLATTTPTRNP